jgi:hypothetical protein
MFQHAPPMRHFPGGQHPAKRRVRQPKRALAIHLRPVTLETEDMIAVGFDDAAILEPGLPVAAGLAGLPYLFRLMGGRK